MSRRRRHARSQGSPTEPDLPITPMLDMSFQLLAFFILTFKPSTSEAQMALQLPPDGSTSQAISTPEVIEPDEPKPITVQVRSNAAGGVSGIEMLLADAAEPKVFANDTELYTALKKIADDAKASKAKLPKVEMEFGDLLSYQLVLKHIDDAKTAGFENVTSNPLDAKPKAKPPAK